jgi:phosphoribosylglycinamide formyltransferase-1
VPDKLKSAEKKRVAVLVSGGGTNLQALLDAQTRGEIPHGEIVLVVSSDKNAYALERAKKANDTNMALDKSDCKKGSPPRPSK